MKKDNGWKDENQNAFLKLCDEDELAKRPFGWYDGEKRMGIARRLSDYIPYCGGMRRVLIAIIIWFLAEMKLYLQKWRSIDPAWTIGIFSRSWWDSISSIKWGRCDSTRTSHVLSGVVTVFHNFAWNTHCGNGSVAHWDWTIYIHYISTNKL